MVTSRSHVHICLLWQILALSLNNFLINHVCRTSKNHHLIALYNQNYNLHMPNYFWMEINDNHKHITCHESSYFQDNSFINIVYKYITFSFFLLQFFFFFFFYFFLILKKQKKLYFWFYVACPCTKLSLPPKFFNFSCLFILRLKL